MSFDSIVQAVSLVAAIQIAAVGVVGTHKSTSTET